MCFQMDVGDLDKKTRDADEQIVLSPTSIEAKKPSNIINFFLLTIETH